MLYKLSPRSTQRFSHLFPYPGLRARIQGSASFRHGKPISIQRVFATRAGIPSTRFIAWIKYGTPILIGGGILYGLKASRNPALQAVIESPACIPPAKEVIPFIIPSPPDISYVERIKGFLMRHIFSPLRTGLRFLHLLIIFAPVIIASPIIFVGVPEARLGGERWGAVWWYDLLTRSMQRAGPTFIKVRSF